MIEQRIKANIKYVGSRLAGRLCVLREQRSVILCYHSVHPRKRYASATPELFREHLQWLCCNTQVVPLSQIRAGSGGAGEGRGLRVAITFDDGYDDNYECAVPILKEFGFTATVFVTAGFVARDQDVMERMAALRQCPIEDVQPLTIRQLGEMVREGIEIGAHTWSHPNLLRLTEAQQRAELERSKRVLEDWLGREVVSLAYPFGKKGRHFDVKTERIAREAGYERAVAVCFRGVQEGDSRFALPRFFVTRDPVEVLAEKVRGIWDWLGRWQESAPSWLARIVSPADFRV